MNLNSAQLYYQNKSLILFLTFTLSFLINKFLISSKKIGQPISTSLSWHMHKQGTPTMGGIGIIGSFFIISYALRLIQPETLFIYGVALASFMVGLLDDLHKIYYQDNRGLGKLDKLWIMLSFIGAIFFAQSQKYSQSIIFATYVPLVIFHDYIKNRFLKGLFSFIIFEWQMKCILIWALHDQVVAFLMAILPAKCGIFLLGMRKIDFFGLLTFLGLGKIDFFKFLILAGFLPCEGKSSNRCIMLSFLLCNSAVYRALSSAQILSAEILPVISVAVTIFFAAAFDLLDGLDGLLGSISSTIFLTFAIFLLPSEPIFLVLFGAIFGFLALNMKPASIFMGDCGSLALGSIFGASLIALWSGTFSLTLPVWSIVKLASMLAFIPLIDFISVAFNIILAKLKQPRFFFAPIHHDLEKRIGEGPTTCVLFLVNLVFCISVALIFRPELNVIDSPLFPGRFRRDNLPERIYSE